MVINYILLPTNFGSGLFFHSAPLEATVSLLGPNGFHNILHNSITMDSFRLLGAHNILNQPINGIFTRSKTSFLCVLFKSSDDNLHSCHNL